MGWLIFSRRPVLVAILALFLLIPLVSSQGTLAVTLSTNKSQYSPGETVTVSGKVTDGQNSPVLGAGVSIQANDPTGAMLYIKSTYSDSSGAYSDTFSLPQGSAQGQYTVFVSVSKAGFNNGQAQTKFSVGTPSTSSASTSSASTSSSQTSSGSTPFSPSPCLIATATFGSELAPEVALLRNFRDTEVLRTTAGTGFMLAFNAFYYSFSPQVASYISSHEYVRTAMKVVLYPLIGILHMTNLLFTILSFNMEMAVTVSGVFAAFAIGLIYLGPIALLTSRLCKNHIISGRFEIVHLVLVCCLTSIGGILVAELTHQNWLLLATTVATVLSFVALGAEAVPVLAKNMNTKTSQ